MCPLFDMLHIQARIDWNWKSLVHTHLLFFFLQVRLQLADKNQRSRSFGNWIEEELLLLGVWMHIKTWNIQLVTELAIRNK